MDYPLKFYLARMEQYRLEVEAYKQRLEDHRLLLALPETMRLLSRLRSGKPLSPPEA